MWEKAAEMSIQSLVTLAPGLIKLSPAEDKKREFGIQREEVRSLVPRVRYSHILISIYQCEQISLN